jgi:hypothetical protein
MIEFSVISFFTEYVVVRGLDRIDKLKWHKISRHVGLTIGYFFMIM